MVNNSHRDYVIIGKILSEIADIHSFVNGFTLEQYLSDVKTQKAVTMTLLNIGELVGSFSEEFLAAHKDIPWRQIRGLRNIAAHKYEIIDQQDVWETITTDIFELEETLAQDLNR